MLASLFVLALTGFASGAQRDGFFYIGGVYDDRYSDSVFILDALKPFGSPQSKIRPYVHFQTNLDSQTLSVQIPNTLTDNFVLGAVGLQYLNGKGLRAFVQAGLTARVGAVAAPEPTGDVRSGVQLFRGWGGLSTGRAAYGNYFGQAGYINRDRNAILYNQIEIGRAFGESRGAVDLYVRGALSLDSHAFYYANTVEGVLGFRVRPRSGPGLTLTAENVFGSYVRAIGRPAGVGTNYRNFRVNVGYGIPF